MSAASLPARGTLSIGEVLSQLRQEFPDVTHLQDPIPGGPGVGAAGPDPVRLPQVLRLGRRPAALRAQPAARPLPAAAGDQGPARGDRPRPEPAGRCVPRAAHLAITDNAPSPEHFRSAPAAMRLSKRGTAQHRRAAAVPAVRAGAVRPDQRALRRLLRRRRAGDRPGGRRAGPVRDRGPAPARVQVRGRSRGRPVRPGGRARWPSSAAGTAGPARRRRCVSWPRCRCGCTPHWCRSASREIVG